MLEERPEPVVVEQQQVNVAVFQYHLVAGFRVQAPLGVVPVPIY